MTGVVELDQIGDKTLTVPATVVTEGTPKAWAYIVGALTPTLGVNYNVTSITDNGVGRYQANFTNVMSLAEFGVLALGQGNGYVTLDNSISRSPGLMATEAQTSAGVSAEATTTQAALGDLA